MNALKKQLRLFAGLWTIGVLLLLWLSAEMAVAQAQQPQQDKCPADKCLTDLFAAMQRLGIPVNLPKDQKDFETDRDNAKKALQNAIRAGTLPGGNDTRFLDSVQAIVCHLAVTPQLPLVAAEQKTRLEQAVLKLRNIFQRLVDPTASAEDLKDWLAKLFFLGPSNLLKFKEKGSYTWNLVRLELVLNNAGAAQEGVFAAPAGGTDVDLVLFSGSMIYAGSWSCMDLGDVKTCHYDPQNGLFLVQTKDIADANGVLFTQQGGRQVPGGEGTLQHYTEISAKHIGANAANWRNAYGPKEVSCLLWPRGILPVKRKCSGPIIPPDLPKTELIIGVLFWNANPTNADKVKPGITGLGLPAGAALNAAQRAVQEALNKEVKGLAIGWKVIAQRQEIRYSCAATHKDTDTAVPGRLTKWGPCNNITNPLRFFVAGDAADFACMAFGIVPHDCPKREQ